jgi:tRNA A37 threonylcarbamoyltransferase TsaD
MDRISESFVRICEAAKAETGAGQVLVSGGVACSRFLRGYCKERGYRFGRPDLCGDNAAGEALFAWKTYAAESSKRITT